MIDLTGKRFGRLEVIGLAGKDKRQECKWLCKCDCGNTKVVYGYHLRKGHTVSCGCRMVTSNVTHGESGTRLYRIWQKMLDRCNNPHNQGFKYYGGRGIKVCPEWESYIVFRDWSLSHGYTDELTIDRIDNYKGYEPSNCRWVTMEVQQKNKRTTVWITHNGITETLTGWGRILNIPHSTIQERYRRGCNIFE